MSFTEQALGVFGGVSIGGKIYTVMERPRFVCPPNWEMVNVLGHVFNYIYAEGLRNPYLEVVLVARDEDEAVFSPTWLSWFLDRSDAPTYDCSVIPGADPPSGSTLPSAVVGAGAPPICFSDSACLVAMYGVKADSFSISTRKGDNMPVTVRFVASAFRSWDVGTSGLAALIANLRPPSRSTSRPLRFDSVSLGGTIGGVSIADKAFSFSLTYSNSLTPNMALNGSTFPVAMNAGKPNGSFAIEMQALDKVPRGEINNLTVTISNASILGGSATRSCTFTLPRLLCLDPDSRETPLGRVMRPYSFTLLGSDASGDLNGDPSARLIQPVTTFADPVVTP